MDELRFGKLEQKVDDIKDDVNNVKMDVHSISIKLDSHMEKIDEHITGDDKIITEIEPLLRELPSLVEIVKKYEIDKELQKRNKEAKDEKTSKYKSLGIKLGVVATVVSIITMVYRTFF